MLLLFFPSLTLSSIIYNTTSKVFTLQTKHTTYQMYIGHLNYFLHLYYGKRIDSTELTHLVQLTARDFDGNPYEDGYTDRSFSLNFVRQEYPTYGGGDYRVPSLEITNGDGTSAVDLRYMSHRIYGSQPKPKIEGLPQIFSDLTDSLEVDLYDKYTNIVVTLKYSVIEDTDSITRSALIHNEGTSTVYLERAMSASLELPTSDWHIISLDGNSQTERWVTRTPLRRGKILIDSLRGASSHEHNDFVIIGSPNLDEDSGEAYGIALLYSGNFVYEAEMDAPRQLRMTVGINPRHFRWQLPAGATFQTPEVIFTYSSFGLGNLSRNLHRLFRANLIRSEWKAKRRPILINNWEATYFAFTDDKLYDIAEVAGSLGIEMLVMDDGWFGHRDNDLTSLGDWTVYAAKLKRGLPQLVSDVNALGLAFGIWFEPECVSEDSDLYRAHPEWAFVIPGRRPVLSRAQLVLDMSRGDVRDYLFGAMAAILSSANISYVKWDFNRHLTDLYSALLPPERQGEIYHRYVLGLYDLLERVTAAFPHILLEGCSGGGGRFDAGMLYYAPQSWMSDDTDAIERLKIQFGTSLAYPVSAFGAHVSVVPNHQTGRSEPMYTRGVVAMSGTFGYELDITATSPEDKLIIMAMNLLYHQYYDVIHDGDLYRLVSPFENQYYCAWMFVAQDGSFALVNVVQVSDRPLAPLVIVKLRGLEEGGKYTISRYPGQVFSGSALMYGGICLPFDAGDAAAWQWEVRRV